jgi:hypothetical protein
MPNFSALRCTLVPSVAFRAARTLTRSDTRTLSEEPEAACGASSTKGVTRIWQIPHTIPQLRDQRAHRASRPGRPLAFDTTISARRAVVERCSNRLTQWRGLATRDKKCTVNERVMVVIASIVI